MPPIVERQVLDLEQAHRAPPQLRVEHVAQAVAEQVEAEHGEDDGEARERAPDRARRSCGSARRTACGPSSASAAARRGRHRRAPASARMPSANWIVPCTISRLAMLGRMCSSVISAVPLPAARAARMNSRGQSASAPAARDAGEHRDVEDADGDDGVDRARPEDRGDHDRRQQRREGEDEIVDAHQDLVEQAAARRRPAARAARRCPCRCRPRPAPRRSSCARRP